MISEVALTLLLLSCAGLMLRSFRELRKVDPGFRAKNLITMKIALPDASYPKADQRAGFLRELRQRLNSTPGIQQAAVTDLLPLSHPPALPRLRTLPSFGVESRFSRPGGPFLNLDVLAIAAHPDDVELTCGGTLLKMAQLGYKTGILDLTAGEMGTRGTPQIRAKEAARAAKLLRVSWRDTLGVRDSDVHASRKHKLRLAGVIRQLRPKTVILPYWEARHPDHYHASELGYEGCFLAGLKQLPVAGEAYRPFKILYSVSYADVRPTFVVDISDQYDQRRKAILAFASQFRPKKSEPTSKVHLAIDRLEEEMNQLARHYGQLIGVQYGEPFLQKELLKVEDVVNMEVRSI